MSINKKTIICNMGFIVMFVVAYLANRNLMIIAALIPAMFILWNKDLSLGIAEILFLLPFSSTMNIAIGTTSLFMLPKLALIICYFIKNKMRINIKLFTLLVLFFAYSLLINGIKDNFPFVRIINLILWLLIAFIVCQTMGMASETTVFSVSYIAGVIVSGLIGMMKNYLPNLARDLISAQYLNESTGNIVQRFAGLWNDPNGYTVFIICALFAAFWLLNNKKTTVLIFTTISAILTVLGIMTLSKSCALLLVMFWVYFVLSNRGMSLKKKIGSGIILGVLCVAGASLYQSELAELIYRFASSSGNDGSINIVALTTHRDTIWREYIEVIWRNNFFFGHGIDAPLVGGYACHNTYLQLLYEWGGGGTLVYISMWLYIVSGVKSTKQSFVPLLFLLVTIFFISCVYIESIYILLPFIICIAREKNNDEKNILGVV